MEIDIIWIMLICLAFFILGVSYGELRTNLRLVKKITENPEGMVELINKIKTEIAKAQQMERNNIPMDSVEIKLEKMNNVYYCYKMDNDQFLGQGTDRDQLLKEVSAKLGNVNIWTKGVTELNQTT